MLKKNRFAPCQSIDILLIHQSTLLSVCLTINGRTPHILIGHLVPRDNYFSCPFTVSQVTRAPATPCPVPFFSSHLSSPFPSASVAPRSFRCCRPPPCRFPLLRAFLPASVPHPGDKLPLNSLPYREIKNGVLWGFRGKNAKEWCLRWDAEEWS
ncbi:uncharacterized protein LOC120686220 isoform X2 [Panicum virgatum]|uniref:uncharacterized protein LOC120686220 isoform X2 n=1 Tax=Panicum virgatum TaxID=38727 RepID=UPI0019D59BC1|nr:uncharacterized protein LOC120686220 isoform X2 [Panicum virgatum]